MFIDQRISFSLYPDQYRLYLEVKLEYLEVNAQYGCCIWRDIHSQLLGPGNELNNLLGAFHSCHKEHHTKACAAGISSDISKIL